MCDEDVNLTLLSAVEKHECLYNPLCEGYSRKEHLEKAWAEVATEVEKPASFCKEKWRVMRIGLLRSLREYIPSGAHAKVKRRKYYLYDAMKFLVPYLRNNRPLVSNVFPDFNEECSLENSDTSIPSSSKIIAEEPEDLVKLSTENLNMKTEKKIMKRKKARRREKKIEKRQEEENIKDKEIIDYYLIKKHETKRIAAVEDKSMNFFLRGLVNDIVSLSRKRQIKFKVQVTQLIQQLHEEENFTGI